MTPEEEQIVELVARWVDDEVRPVARALEHANSYPEGLIEQMKQMGVYGLPSPSRTALGVSTPLLRAGHRRDRPRLDVAWQARSGATPSSRS